MPKLWTNNPEFQAAFIHREIERQGRKILPVTNLVDVHEEQRALENNRLIVAEYLNRDDILLCLGKQVHGSHVACTNKPGILEATDGLVTDQPGLAVGVLVADCAALLFADPINKIIAAVHAGWRGVLSGIIPEAIREMEKIGAEPDLVHVYISPCISTQSFEVGEEVASQFSDRYVDRTQKKPHVDLRAFIEDQLLTSGILEDMISRDEKCTLRHPQTLHSHRRDGLQSGRMMGVIFISE